MTLAIELKVLDGLVKSVQVRVKREAGRKRGARLEKKENRDHPTTSTQRTNLFTWACHPFTSVSWPLACLLAFL